MRRRVKTYLRFFLRKFGAKCFLVLIIVALVALVNHNSADKRFKIALPTIQLRHQRNAYNMKKDWHDYKFIEYEKSRVGFGEQGVPAILDDTEDQARIDDLLKQNGYNGALSDKISVNRSIPDIRHFGCQNKTYLSVLPTVSVVVPFCNEHFSTLMRTAHSIVNRSPKELLLEIILVDDGSDKELLKEHLDKYVAENLPKVKIVRRPERLGLIAARLDGAKEAVGEVLIFLDAHTEVNTNWLPPLLEPIADDYKVCVCPFIDYIDAKTFKYHSQDEGARGAFDWFLQYKRLPLLSESLAAPTEPFESPVMAGGLFAINAKFFWELGGYDEGLEIWGGEQYELSFKIWQCGGKMYDAPCSRVGHIYRSSGLKNPRKTDTLAKNLKRVAEVWMDEYKEYFYSRDRSRFGASDAGDLSKQHAIRERLQCKPFKWFMENVAFDLNEHYPYIEPTPFAFGVIRSVAQPSKCIDSLGHTRFQEIGIYQCSDNSTSPQFNQEWSLSKYKDVRLKNGMCWDVSSPDKNAPVILYNCHKLKNNQYWQYDEEHQWLVHGLNHRCLDFDVASQKVFINVCDTENRNMKWEWGFLNKTALLSWDDEENN